MIFWLPAFSFQSRAPWRLNVIFRPGWAAGTTANPTRAPHTIATRAAMTFPANCPDPAKRRSFVNDA